MSSANIELAVQRGKGESAVHRIGGRDGAPLHISAQSGANYLLKREDGEAPENVTLKRSGDDLEVTLEGDAAPSVVIEDYFSQAQSPGLFGKDATGQLHEFVRTDGQGGIFTLKEGETEAAALGTAPASLNDDDGNGFIGLLPLLLAGAGLAGLAAYAIAKNDDDEPEPPVRQPAGGVESADDDVGTITGPIAAGGVTDDAAPEFHGRANAGDTIKIYDNGQLIGQTVADASGNWVVTPSDLPDGMHAITVTNTPAGGTESPPSAPFVFTSDTTPPAPSRNDQATDDKGPDQGPIPSGGTTDDDTPTLSGEVEAGSQVVIEDNGQPIGTATVDDDGQWTFTPETPLQDGEHNLVPVVIDPAGNEAPGEPIVINVDTQAPAVPTIGMLTDNQGLEQGPLANGALTDDDTPTLSGQAEAGSLVSVHDNGALLGSVMAGEDGTWAYTPAALADGAHAFTAAATDAAGNSSAPSAPFTITTDHTPPDAGALAITGVQDDQGTVRGNVVAGGTTDDTTPLVSGTGTAGDTIIVMVGSRELGRATVDGAGGWSVQVDAANALATGTHAITALERDAAGNQISSAPYEITVPGGAPAAPSIVAVSDDVGAAGPQALQKGEVTNDATPTFSGTSQPGTVVYLYEGDTSGAPIGSSSTDADGNWQISPSLGEGAHSLVAQAVDTVGQTSPATLGWDLSVDTTPPAPSQNNAADDNQGDQTGPIAAAGTTDDSTPTLSGEAEPGSQVVIEDNGVPIGTATVDGNGNWSFTPDTPLADGAHSLVPVVIDAAGNETPSDPIVLNVDTSNVSVAIGAVLDDVNAGGAATHVADGGVTNDARPEFTGTAKPGSTVTLLEGGAVLGTAQVGADGQWRIEPAATLGEGAHSVVAQAVDAAGNQVSTPAFGFSVDTQAPAAPTIGAVNDDIGYVTGDLANGAVTDDNAPTLKGMAEPGSVVTIYDNGAALDSVQADAQGAWSYTPVFSHTEGEHAFTTTATDAAGNTSAPSPAFTITTDYTAPDAGALAITGVQDDQGTVRGNVVAGGTTDDTTPLVSGTGTAGDTIIVMGGSRELGRATVDGAGGWSVQVDAANALATGTHAITALERDAAGNQISSAPYEITVDTAGPAQPAAPQVIDDQGAVTGTLASGDTTDDVRPEFRGSGQAGDTVTVMNGAQVIGSTTVRPDGTWSITPATDLTDGNYSFTTDVSDPAGNASAPSQPVDITIASGTSSAPQITGLTDDVTPVTGSVAAGGSTNDVRPEIAGTGDPGELITVYDGATAIGTATVNAQGMWAMEPQSALADGTHSITATATNAAGNISPASAAFDFIVDTIAPTGADAAVIRSVIDDAIPATGMLNSGDSTNDAQPTFQGSAQAGDTVRLYDGATLLGETQAAGDGNWSLDVTLAEGAHSITAQSVDAAGNVGSQSAPFVLTVDITPPSSVSITGVNDNFGISQGNVANGGVTDDNTPQIMGQADPGTQVIVQATNAFGTRDLGPVTVAADGTWSLQVSQALANDTYQFVAVASDAAGNSLSSSAYAVTVSQGADVARAVIDLAATSDNGPSASDNITSVSNPVINGTVIGLSVADVADINAGNITATLFDDGNGNGTLDSGETVLASGIALTSVGSGGATFSQALPLLGDGTYNVKSVLVSAGGNQSTTGLLDDDPAARLVIDRDQPTSGASTQADDGLGWDMTSAGDFNGDGFEDFLVSAPHIQWGSDGGGAESNLYLVYGGVNGLPELPDIDAMTAQQGVRFDNMGVAYDINKTGININQAGDINGDGYDDLIISGHREDGAYVIFGRETGTAQIGLGNIFASGANSDGFRFGWGDGWAGDGASAGDINGDGYSDILITESSGNKMYVLYGNGAAAGNGSWSYNYDLRADGLYNHATGQKVTNGTAFISSPGGNSSFGDHLNVVGDVNNDGYQDFIVTYPDETAGSNANAGNAYLVFGSAQSLPATMTLADYASIGIRISGTEYGEQLGDIVHAQGPGAHGDSVYGASNTVAALGDINGDGIGDFAIGSPGWGDNVNDDGMAPGRTYVVFGKEGGWADFTLDTLNGTNGFTLSATGLDTDPTFNTDANLGNGLRGAGDVNGDGLDDFLVGAPNADTNGLTDNGVTYLVYGRAGGYQADMDLDDLVASGQARRWDGAATRDFSGTNAAVGDWNGDGLDDIGISAWESDAGALDGGQYTIYGGEVDRLTQAFTAGDDTLAATAGVDRMGGGVGNDTIAGVSIGDVAYGGAGDDTIGVLSDGFSRVDGGLGIDTLVFNGAGMNVDLSALGLKVQGFEKFDLGTGNTLSLSATDVIANGERDLAQQDGKVQVQVDGDAGVLNLSSTDNWASQGTTQMGGTQYSVYTSGNAELLVEDKVQVAIL